MTARLIGMIHLGPLPGAPAYTGDLAAVTAAAATDARVLEEAGFDAVMVENFGDRPFFADDVPKVTVAAMAVVAAAVGDAVAIPVGINVLRNDALAAVAIAAAAGAALIRVNVLAGTMTTDQGVITGKAAEVARLRAALGWQGEVLADVFVKHASPPSGTSLADAARDTWERAGADALIVTGAATGWGASLQAVREVKAAVPEAPVLVGSGIDPGSIAGFLELADGVIVGTALKAGGITTNPVDPDRARALVTAARGA